MVKIVNDNHQYAQVVLKMGVRSAAAGTDFSDILAPEVEEAMKETAQVRRAGGTRRQQQQQRAPGTTTANHPHHDAVMPLVSACRSPWARTSPPRT